MPADLLAKHYVLEVRIILALLRQNSYAKQYTGTLNDAIITVWTVADEEHARYSWPLVVTLHMN